MISIETWSPWAAIIVVGGPILLCYVSFFYSLYLSRRHLDRFLQALNGSRQIVISAAGLAQSGWLSRLLLVAKITFMVMWPGPGLRAGDLDVDDIRNFPVDLKRLLKVKAILTCVILIWGALAFALVKLK
ncbi:hypothetical protein QF017_006098 [Pseudomonas laurylsulfatiphila]|jgi:hypothetical protein|uniref:hypothetical protein n=1 Tax=Pseudomonas laurylsulfatiphila TaxID=2011015 RepID=UPI003D2541C9|nr:hypothetical protein [Pseudomonas reinekei]